MATSQYGPTGKATLIFPAYVSGQGTMASLKCRVLNFIFALRSWPRCTVRTYNSVYSTVLIALKGTYLLTYFMEQSPS